MTMSPTSPYGQVSPVPPSRMSKSAVTSLVCGIIVCIPIAPLLAIIFGFMGLGKTSNPQVRGRVLAIIGLILGFLGVAGWATGGYVGWRMYQGVVAAIAPIRITGEQFATDMGSGDTAHAATLVSSKVTAADILQFSTKFRALGKYKGFRDEGWNGTRSPGAKTMEFNGTASFDSGDQPAIVRIVFDGKDPKIDDVEIGSDIKLKVGLPVPTP